MVVSHKENARAWGVHEATVNGLMSCARDSGSRISLSQLSRHNTFLEHIKTPVCIVDKRLRPHAINTALSDLLDISEPKAVFRALSRWINPRNTHEILANIRQCLAGISTNCRFWGTLPSGESCRYSTTMIPLYLDSAEPVAVAVVFNDFTTELSRTIDEALASNNYELGVGEWLWETDRDGRFTYVSPGYEKHVGEKTGNYIGKTTREVLLGFFGVADLNDINSSKFDVQRYLKIEEKTAQHLAYYDFVYSRSVNGKDIWLLITGIPCFSSETKQHFVGYRGIIRDISHLGERFEGYRTISNAVDILSVGIAIFSKTQSLESFNSSLIDHLGLTNRNIEVGITLSELAQQAFTQTEYEKETRQQKVDIEKLIEGFSSGQSELEWQDGESKWFRCDFHQSFNGGLVLEVRDISRQKQSQIALASQKNMLTSLIDSMPDPVFALDCSRRYIVANTASVKCLGGSDQERIIGKLPEEVYSNLISAEVLDEIKREELNVLSTGKALFNQERHYKAEGKNLILSLSKVPIRDAEGEVVGLVCHGKDVSYLHDLTEQLSHQAEHDMLTGLINRRGFDHKIGLALKEKRLTGTNAVVCFVDLDRFKAVNDTVGHHAGDELLKQISQILVQGVRNVDIVGRLGGDEFGLILKGCSLKNASRLVEDLLEKITTHRFQWDGKLFEVGASVGMVELDENHTGESLLSCADMACYTAKTNGRGSCHIYSDSDSITTRRRTELHLSTEIRDALDNDRFALFKQPIAVTSSPELNVHHYEVLLRMRGRDGVLISPAKFIPVAERFDLMPAIDRWVISHALQSYSEAFLDEDPVVMTINLSGLSLSDPAMGDFIVDQIQKNNVDPRNLCFEITETAFVSNLSQAQSFIAKVNSLGCTFALDDFGSGLSSFAYLKKFEINYLKIDGCFIRNIVEDSTDRAMVAAINDVGHTLGMLTIAEFVESDDHISVLRELGVDYVQGYGIEAPSPLIDEVRLLSAAVG